MDWAQIPAMVPEQGHAEWGRIVQRLQTARKLDAADPTLVTAYVMAYSRWVSAQTWINENDITVSTPTGGVAVAPEVRVAALSLEQMRKLLADLGLKTTEAAETTGKPEESNGSQARGVDGDSRRSAILGRIAGGRQIG